MHVLLTVLLLIAGLLVLILLLALVGKKEYSLSRSISINRPVATVYEYIRFLKNQDEYNVWTMMDPQMKKTYTGTDGQVGFIYAWDGNKQAGAGEQEVIALTANEEVMIDVRFKRPFPGIIHTPLRTEKINDDQTQVTWSMNSRMAFPRNIFLYFINMDKVLGKELEKSLSRLKTRMEK
ncbi:MAG: SRPBCC family protein [Chitinophagaceae bacterium]|nr:SRPBCC family protein [Chitinophagaceae bacterium]